jgi:hypothetical protein
MALKLDDKVLVSELVDFYDYNTKFSYESHQLAFAAALSSYSDAREIEDDPRYGTLHLAQYQWGHGDEKDKKYTNIESHVCTEQELAGLYAKDEDSPFFPLADNHMYDLERERKKFMCPDEDQISIYGQYDMEKGQHFSAVLRTCQDGGDVECASESEIKDWLRGKFIVLIFNERTLNLTNHLKIIF